MVRSVKGVPLAVFDREYLEAFMLQVAINTNHQNGRDSHLRQVKVLSPLE